MVLWQSRNEGKLWFCFLKMNQEYPMLLAPFSSTNICLPGMVLRFSTRSGNVSIQLCWQHLSNQEKCTELPTTMYVTWSQGVLLQLESHLQRLSSHPKKLLVAYLGVYRVPLSFLSIFCTAHAKLTTSYTEHLLLAKLCSISILSPSWQGNNLLKRFIQTTDMIHWLSRELGSILSAHIAAHNYL